MAYTHLFTMIVGLRFWAQGLVEYEVFAHPGCSLRLSATFPAERDTQDDTRLPFYMALKFVVLCFLDHAMRECSVSEALDIL